MEFTGLTSAEVLTSRNNYGINLITPPKRVPWWILYLEKFSDPIIRILIIAAGISLLIGIIEKSFYESIGIILAIFLTTSLSFFNEYKAGKEFDVLNKVNDDTPVKVLRDGTYVTISKKDVVVNDLVIIETGEEIPADGEILKAVDLQINESKLTGESVPVKKTILANAAKEQIHAYPDHLIFSQTNVTNGYGVIKIIAVGDETQAGKTMQAALSENTDKTPLTKQLEKLSKILGIIAFFTAGLIFIALIVTGLMRHVLLLNKLQFNFLLIAGLALFLLLIPVLKPLWEDFKELTWKKTSEKSTEKAGLLNWIKWPMLSILAFITCIALGNFFQFIPLDAHAWLPYKTALHLLDYFMIAVTIIVVAVPEGLPMSVTLSLAYSMRKMLADNNLVRKMHACETIGAVTTICTDKTGTLTQNSMKVFEAHFATQQPQLISEAICANSTAHLEQNLESKEFSPIGNPTEGALLLWLYEQKIDYLEYRNDFVPTEILPFSTENKFMAILGKSKVLDNVVLYVKGAPEIVLNSVLVSDIEKQKISAQLKSFQERGFRTLGFAYKIIENTHKEIKLEARENLTWMGFCVIADPIRDDVPEAIRLCQKAGIDIKIITGDNLLMAKEIAAQVGILNKQSDKLTAVTSDDLHQMTDEQVKHILPDLKVIARAKPLDKLRLVNLLKQMHHVVAVTGDGTNDGPALNAADVGLAMGKTGTAVAKEASDIILLNDSFTSIVNAILWGRSLYQNIQRFIVFQATISFVALIIALLGPFLGIALPFTVTQMLWINLIIDTFAALALATEPPRPEVMSHPPRNPKSFIINFAMIKQLLISGLIFITVLIYLLIDLKNYESSPLLTYKLTFFFSLFVFIQLWNLFKVRLLFLKQVPWTGLWQNKSFLMIVALIFSLQILITQFGGKLFRTVPLVLLDWGYIIGFSFLIVWAPKIISYPIYLIKSKKKV